jgi:hypothetical protein
MNYVWWSSDTYGTADSDQSLAALADTGTNWVALVVTWYQNDHRASSITPDLVRTPTDDSLVHAIRNIHRLGMRIMLKPHVDLLEENYWRGQIDPEDIEKWFASYQVLILHYARLANAENVEQLSIGTELVSMTKSAYTTYWAQLIEAVRGSYPRKLVYCAALNEWETIEFWDKLDYAGIDAYFPLTETANPTVTDLEQAWQRYANRVKSWQTRVKRQVLFTEIGWWSADGANMGTLPLNRYCAPASREYDPTKCKLDQQEQADLYQATFETFWNSSWFQGFFWWAWYPYGTRLGWGEGGPSNVGYSPHNKQAEKVLRHWYRLPYVPEGTPPGAVPALIAIQHAESAIVEARRDDRTAGLDLAVYLIARAIAAYDRRDFAISNFLANVSSDAADISISWNIVCASGGLALSVLLIIKIRRRKKGSSTRSQ